MKSYLISEDTDQSVIAKWEKQVERLIEFLELG